MSLMILIAGIALLLILIMGVRMSSLLALIIASLFVGVAEGIPFDKIFTSIENGMGGTLGGLSMIIAFGTMLGKLLLESGAAQRISMTMMKKFGRKNVRWTVCILSFILGIVLFYEVGFVMLLPIIVSFAVSAGIPLLELGIPMCAALSVAHAFLPPHPGATGVAILLNADIGLTLLYGIVISIPCVIISGPLFCKLGIIRRMKASVPEGSFTPRTFREEEMPSFGVSMFTAIFPVALIACSSIAKILLPKDSSALAVIDFIGNADMALLLGVLWAVYIFGIHRGHSMSETMKMIEDSLGPICLILLVTGAGGSFKQVLVDSGLGAYIGEVMSQASLSPYIFGWAVASIIRLAVGSATVASLTSAGIVSPVLAATGVSPELMVLAIGSGSTMFGLVNDPGFWMYKEFFSLSVKDTLISYSTLNTIIGVGGLVGVLILSPLVNG